jgi:hypothetical protein
MAKILFLEFSKSNYPTLGHAAVQYRERWRPVAVEPVATAPGTVPMSHGLI